MSWPICMVEVYGRSGAYELHADGSGNAPSGDLLSVQTDKQLGVETPAGVFDLRLTAQRDAQGRTWADKLAPQDVVVIQMLNWQGRTGPHGAGELQTVMIGLIDSISSLRDITPQGRPQRQIQVRGRDAAKLFLSGQVTYWSFLGAALLGSINFLPQDTFNAEPDLSMVRILEDIFKRFLKIQLNGPGNRPLPFWDLLGYALTSYSGELPKGLDVQCISGEGTFWSFLTKLASPPFHELFVDTRRVGSGLFDGLSAGFHAPAVTLGRDRSAPALILRPTPFPYLLTGGGPEQTVLPPATDADWQALTTHEVGADDLVTESFQDELTISDAEQYTMYLAYAHYSGLGPQMSLMTTPPVLDPAKFFRYGYKPLMPATWLTSTKDPNNQDDTDWYQRLSWRLASWYALNVQFLSGSKTYKLLPHVHIGERLIDRTPGDPPRMFYVERVSHRFAQFEQATTTLGLTRGLRTDQYDHYKALLSQVGLTMPAGTSKIAQQFQQMFQVGQGGS